MAALDSSNDTKEPGEPVVSDIVASRIGRTSLFYTYIHIYIVARTNNETAQSFPPI